MIDLTFRNIYIYIYIYIYTTRNLYNYNYVNLYNYTTRNLLGHLCYQKCYKPIGAYLSRQGDGTKMFFIKYLY